MRKKNNSCIWLALFLTMALLRAGAQTTITPGSHLIVAPGATLVSTQSLNVQNGGNLLVSGTLDLKMDLVNQNVSQDDLGPGTVKFTGAVCQNLSGLNTFQNLTLQNTQGLNLGGDSRINGVLALTDGRITLGPYNLYLGPAASIPSGSLNNTRMVVATDDGGLQKEFSGPGSFMFPLGDVDGNADYTPVTITFPSGTIPAGYYMGIRLQNVNYPSPQITGNYLNRYWVLKHSSVNAPQYNALFQYVPEDVTGNEAALSCSRVNNQTWSTYSPASAALHQLTASGVTGVGTFTGLKSTTPNVYQELVNINTGSGVTHCYDATQILYVAGNGNTFVVANGGSVTLVAGVKISILPGTQVQAGGYLHGYITTNGIYCGSSLNPLVANTISGDEPLAVPSFTKDQLIRVYPNPTADLFNVESARTGNSGTIQVDVFSLQGQRLMTRKIAGDSKHVFSLASYPVGMYVIQARSETQTEITRIVKY